MTNRGTWIAWGLAGAVFVLVLAFAFAPTRVDVEVASVRRQTLRVTVEEQGRTRARESFVVAAPITGRLLRTAVEEGDPVSRGEVLATMLPPPIDPREVASLRAELAVAEARKREAEAQLSESESASARAESEAARRELLFERDAVSIETQEQYQQAARAAKARLQTSRASLRAARAELEGARARLMSVDAANEEEKRGLEAVSAPVSGTVLSVFEESERVVAAGAPLFELINADGLEIVADLLTEQAVRVESGASVEITGWGGDEVVKGRVRYVEPKGFKEVSALGVDEQRVNVVIDLMDAPDSLGAEFRVEVAIVTWSADDVLTIPTSALFRRGRGWSTFAVESGRARLRSVEIGHRGTERAELLSGLEEGGRVIVFPSDLVEDGVRLNARAGAEYEINREDVRSSE